MNVQAGAIPWRACHLAGMTALCFSLLLAVACPARGAEIHRAVALGEGEKVRQLIEHDRSLISAPDIDGSTPLHVAAERGRKEIAAFLLSSGAVADARNREKQTPLHVAARWGHRSVLNLLLNAQCDVKAEDIYGYTPVSWVCTQGDVELVALLLGKGASIPDGAPCLASSAGNLSLVQLLVMRGADVNELWHTETPLIAASSAGHVAVTEFLLSKGADPQRKDRFGRTALSSAVRAGHKEVATILLRTASRHAKNEALYAACEVSNPALVQLLISHGADVNAEVGAEGMRPLHAAVSGQNAEVVKLLVDNGCDVNAKLKGLSQGTTPLHRAARRDGVPPEIIRILLQAGADVNARDFAMRTPLHFAAGKEGNTEIVRLLVQHGSDVRACDDRGRTPLTYALTNGEAETAEILRKAAESTR